MNRFVYLDANATTPIDPRVRSAMLPYLGEGFANPSSLYHPARQVRGALEEARLQVAKLINADPQEVVFTSGGTEADNAALKGVAGALRHKGRHIITSRIEHHAVLHTCRYLEGLGFEVTYLPVDRYGIVDLEALENEIRVDTILVSIMYANNEIGTVQPIEEVVRIAHRHGVLVHTDAVQAVGKIPIDVKGLEVDLLSLSGHKFYAPKGVGILYVRSGLRLEPLLHGGHQEGERRAGTENVLGIIGLGAAAEIARAEMHQEEYRIRRLRDRLQEGILEKIPEVLVNGHPERRLANTLSCCIKGVEGEGVVIGLDIEGICASSGSACTSGSAEPSHVLLAIGVPAEWAQGGLRLSLSRFTTDEDIDRVLEVLPKVVERLRRISPLWQREAAG